MSDFVPGYEASLFLGIGAPKNTPAEIVAKLNTEVNAALADPKIKARLADLGNTPLALSPADFGKLLADETEKWGKVVKFTRAKPDIVLMDITMPQMEGIEAVERIVRQHPDARIVMVSSVGYQENILAALQKGAKHFVQKPVKPEVLYEILRYVLGDDPNAVGAPVALAGEHLS